MQIGIRERAKKIGKREMRAIWGQGDQGRPSEARGARGGQLRPGEARGCQEKPAGARGDQARGDQRGQERLGGARGGHVRSDRPGDVNSYSF